MSTDSIATIVGIVLILLILASGGVAVVYYLYIEPYFDEKKKKKAEEEKLSKMTEQEKKEYYKEKNEKMAYSAAFQNELKGGLPTICPNCHTSTYPLSKWILVSTKTAQVEKLDKAYRLGGATTVFTKQETKQARTYKCPKCDYTHTVER